MMAEVHRDLSRSLHALTARLGRAADGILQAEQNVSYRRFLTLYAVREMGGTTQRDLARWMGVTEPSVSRMTGVLVEAGFLEARADRAGGNRRHLQLTAAGEALIARCGALLEDRFAALVESAGVSYDDYGASTRRLLVALSDGEISSTKKPAGADPASLTSTRRRPKRAS
jgi:DNA-binding MarR family transcriptional regulator